MTNDSKEKSQSKACAVVAMTGALLFTGSPTALALDQEQEKKEKEPEEPGKKTTLELASGEEASSSIANIPIQGQSYEAVLAELTTLHEEWAQTPFILKVGSSEVMIPTSAITFDLENTALTFVQNARHSWYEVWKSEPNYNGEWQVSVDEEVIAEKLAPYAVVDVDATIQKMEAEISATFTHIVEAEANYAEELEEVIASTSIPVTVDALELSRLVGELNGEIELQPNEEFSLLDSLMNDYDDETLSFLASAVHSVALHTNYEVRERHAHFEQFGPYDLAFEAMIDQSVKKDFKMANPNIVPGTFNVKVENEQLIVELHSLPLGIEVEVYRGNEQKIEPRTVYHYSDELAPHQTIVESAGAEGASFELYRKVSYKHSAREDIQQLSSMTYTPKNHVVTVSTKEAAAPVTTGSASSTTDTTTEQAVAEVDLDRVLEGLEGKDLSDASVKQALKDALQKELERAAAEGKQVVSDKVTEKETNKRPDFAPPAPAPQVDDMIFDEHEGPDSLGGQYDKAGNKIN